MSLSAMSGQLAFLAHSRKSRANRFKRDGESTGSLVASRGSSLGRASVPVLIGVVLFQAGRYGRERRRKRRSDSGNGADDHDGDQRRDQAVFDRGRAGLIFEELQERLHGS